MSRTRALPLPTSRLLTRAQAAGYCAMTFGVFSRECPVRPIAFGDGAGRLELYDRLDLDAWIDNRKTPAARMKSAAEALAEMDG